MPGLSVNTQLDLAQHEASAALDALREAVGRGREALAALADLKEEKDPKSRDWPPPSR